MFRLEDGTIQIGDEPGFSSEIEDESGFFGEFLRLLDGSLSLEDIRRNLSSQFPEVTLEDLQQLVRDLDENGHLEAMPGYDRQNEHNRYLSNLNYLQNFSSIEVSPQDLQDRLHGTSIAVVGLGGLGSNILMQLAGLGYRKIFAIEPDRLEAKNLNRQFLYRTEDLGAYKA
ncbi:MAG TPA: ThiF family adenylyltransferase, partial [Bacilli bacterium]|nr:ThiF family adenylyltransferase [Bacilli bacterium]